MALFIILFLVGFLLIKGGWFIGKSVGNVLFSSETKPTYIDNSITINHNYHDHKHNHKNLTIIDDETHKKGLDNFNLN